MNKTAWTNPVLRWAGSKRKLVPLLVSQAPSRFSRYVEPFVGSACLFFAIHPSKAILGDINGELIATYLMIRKHPRLIASASAALKNSSAVYYRIREAIRDEKDPFLRAVYFIYLNRYCFNGVYRTNRNGHFNVPFGQHTGSMPSTANFYRCSVALRNATLLAGDFRNTIEKVRSGDFVYLDPPYSSCDRPRYGEYGYGSFQPLDLESLVTVMKQLHDKGSSFLVSYSDSPLTRDAFSEYNMEPLRVRRHVAGFAKHRGEVGEIIIKNY